MYSQVRLSGSQNPVEVIRMLYYNKKWDEVIAFCKKMLESDENDLVAIQNMATAFLHTGKYEDALYWCHKVLNKDEFDEYALKNKIFALEKLGRHQDILECADKLLQKNQNDAWAYDSKGLAFNELGKHEDAIWCYNKSLLIDKNGMTALLNKAVTLAFLRKYEDAILFYDQAQKVDGTIREIGTAKAGVYLKQGKEDEAFLAAQGLLVEDIEKYINEARQKKMRVFDLYCLKEYLELQKKNHD